MGEPDRGIRNSTSNVRSGGKACDRCMENCFQCTGDMLTGHDFLPVYGPSCGMIGYLGTHTWVDFQALQGFFVAVPIEANGLGMGTGPDCDSCAMKTWTVILRERVREQMGLVSTSEKGGILKYGV